MSHMRPIVRDQKYLDHLKQQRCVLTGVYAHDNESVVPIHIGTAGRGLKSSDDETLPILHSLHMKGHNHGEVSMLRKYAPDDLLRDAFRALAREMYADWLKEQKR